ncbi:Peptide methionine sulfoxide reductase MsrB [Klebsiella pneumoniae]|uniref:peptide-methionine (R)-S-oxide reductase n=1 Tax=Klebsiella pneumoniae TaxID=573 RepID=A0A2X3F9F0_KLEPN|nr:Peptide methionine sulfoxide reductase MsrB [Klebsiella pneumoniae]
MANKPTPEELKNGLSEMQFYVTQHHGTEPPFTGRLLHNKKNGVYHCLVCDAPLFNSQTKYDSGCGWPSFYEPVSGGGHSLSDRQFARHAAHWRSVAETVMPISATCFRMVRSRPASAIVSTRHR